jgi:hypothetical protein
LSVRIEVPLTAILAIGDADSQQTIQEQAALDLGVHKSFLVEFSRYQRQLYKRPRLNTDLPMSSPYSDMPPTHGGLARSPRSSLSATHPHHLHGHHGFDEGARCAVAGSIPEGDDAPQDGWSRRRLADLFNTCSFCPPLTGTYDSQAGKQHAAALATISDACRRSQLT